MKRMSVAGAGILALLLAALPAAAQQRPGGPGWAADSLLRWFELEANDAPRNTGEVGMGRVLFVLRHPEAVSAAKQDSVADGLERLALRRGRPDAASQAAVSYLALGGQGSEGTALRGATARLSRIYRLSGDRAVRSQVLMLASTLDDRPGMVSVLREAATTPPDPTRQSWHDDGSEPAVLALVALSRMGDVGRGALAELARSGRVQSPHAKARLESLTAPRN